MGYNLKRVKMVSKKDYNTRAFGSKFCIDEKGSLYIYTKEDRISRVDLDRTVEDFLLSGMQWTHNADSLCFAPIVVEDGIFHLRHEEEGYYFLKTDMGMKEIFRVTLEGGYCRKMFWYDGFIYFTIDGNRSCQDKKVLVKMDTNGTICWEYSMETEDITDSKVVPLSGGRVLVPIKKDYEIYKFHVIDKDGMLLYQITDNKWIDEERRGRASVIKDNIGNVCIYTMGNNQFGKIIIDTTVIDKEGKEFYRGSISLAIFTSFLFVDGKYFYEDFNEYPNYNVRKIDFTTGSQKIIFSAETMIISMGSCVDEKVYICHRVEKQSTITCFDKEEKELWKFTTKEWILLFEIKGDYLYFTTKNRICIYRIEEE